MATGKKSGENERSGPEKAGKQARSALMEDSNARKNRG